MTVRSAARRLSVMPFETAIAWLLIITGIAGGMHYGVTDPVAALLPAWEATLLSAMSGVTGALMLAGAGIPHRGAEAAGLLFLCGVIVSRFVLYGFYLGFGPSFAVTGIFDTALVWAAVARLAMIGRREVLVRVSEPPK